MKIILKEIINLPISLIFLFVNVLHLFLPKNLSKITNYKNILIHRAGGFGNQIFANDIIRYSKKEYLYILLFDPTRYNKYVSKVFSINHIYLPTCYGKKLSYNFRIGEYEGSFTSLNFYVIKLILKYILSKNVLEIESFYKIFEKENKKIIKKINFNRKNFKIFKKYIDIYFHKVNDKQLPNPKLNPENLRKIHNKLRIKNIKINKICSVYLRKKYSPKSDESNNIRNGSPKEDYKKMFEHLIKKKFTIFLVGDTIFNFNEIRKFKKRVIDYRIAQMRKDIFQIYALTENNIFISEPGGAQFFGLYSKKSFGINYFPIGFKPPFNKILHKNIIDKKGKLIKSKIKKKIFWKYNISGLGLKAEPNTSIQLLNLVKKNIY